MQENKTALNIKNFFNPKILFSIFVFLIFLCIDLFYFFILFLEHSSGNIPEFHFFDCPPLYFLYVFVLFASLSFLLWKKNIMTQ